MELEIVRGPFILYEPVDMLYKFVNGLSFRSLLNRRVSMRGDTAAKKSCKRNTEIPQS